MKVLAGILIAVVGTLVWALYSLRETRVQRSADQQSNEVVILDFSNRWEAVRRSLNEQKQVNEVLETNLVARGRELESLRVEMAGLSTDLARSRAETRTAKDEIAKRDQQISALEDQNGDLNKQMGDLKGAITGLEGQITEAERKLVAAEGNRQELLAELRRLQDEKIAMEKQLNDLEFVRDQVRKLKEELTIARRLDWIRRGIYATPRKGAEALTARSRPEAAPAEGTPVSPNLDVEIRRTGEINVNPPGSSGTPATNAAPAPR